jgi:hypothetical protein
MADSEIQFPNTMTVTLDGPVITTVDDEENLCLKVAIQLYTYADFSKIQNPQDYAKDCLLKGNEFVKAYKKFKKKTKLEIV